MSSTPKSNQYVSAYVFHTLLLLSEKVTRVLSCHQIMSNLYRNNDQHKKVVHYSIPHEACLKVIAMCWKGPWDNNGTDLENSFKI